MSHFAKFRTALRDAVDALSESQDYAVIMFDTNSWPLGLLALVSATSKNKANTIRALGQVVADGGTSPCEAMKSALDLKPDAIVLLSDGEFGALEVLQITQYNHSGRRVTTIHCVGLQQNIETLRQLAKDNGNGAYTTAKLLSNP